MLALVRRSMRTGGLILVFALSLVTGVPAGAQERATESPTIDWAEQVRGQVSLGLGPFGYQGELSVAIRVAGPWSVGGGGGYGWEEPLEELDTRVLSLIHFDLFARYQDREEVFLDAGLTGGWFDRVTDRSGGCSHSTCGWLAGLYVAPGLGYRWVFVSLRLRVVLVDDEEQNRIGYILTPLLRGVVSW